MVLGAVMENVIHIISYLVIGMGLRRTGKFPEETPAVLNLYVIYVCLPALTLLKVPGLEFSSALLAPVAMPWFMLAVSAVLVLAVSRWAGWDEETAGALLLLVPMGNTSFLGIPMVRAFFGEAGVPYAVLYDQLGSFLILSTYGAVVLAVHGGGERPRLAAVAGRIVTFPPFIALVAAFVLPLGMAPPAVRAVLGRLADTLVPVVMIAVGFQLRPRLSSAVLRPLGAGLGMKLVVAPLIALAACRLLGGRHLAAQVAVFEAGMPPMVSAGALALMAGLAPELSAALVGVGIPASFLTLSLLYALML